VGFTLLSATTAGEPASVFPSASVPASPTAFPVAVLLPTAIVLVEGSGALAVATEVVTAIAAEGAGASSGRGDEFAQAPKSKSEVNRALPVTVDMTGFLCGAAWGMGPLAAPS